MPRVTPPRSPRSEPAQAAASGADSSVGPSVPPTPDQRSEPAAAETQAAAPSADSLGVRVGVDAPELEVTSLSHLGEQGASALELFVEPLEPPAAAAGAGTDSSRRGSAASSAGSGPTIFPFSDIEVDHREVELEEPFAGPDVNWDGQDPPGEGAAAVCAAPVDPGGETIPNSSDQVHQDPEHSLGNTQAASVDQDLPVPVEKSSNSLNLVDQDQPVHAGPYAGRA